jgi:hypothetical protein
VASVPGDLDGERYAFGLVNGGAGDGQEHEVVTSGGSAADLLGLPAQRPLAGYLCADEVGLLPCILFSLLGRSRGAAGEKCGEGQGRPRGGSTREHDLYRVGVRPAAHPV